MVKFFSNDCIKHMAFFYWSYDAKNFKLDINFETKYDS